MVDIYRPYTKLGFLTVKWDDDGETLPDSISFNRRGVIEYLKEGAIIPPFLNVKATFAPTNSVVASQTASLSDTNKELDTLYFIGAISLTETAADVFVQLCRLDKVNGFVDFKERSTTKALYVYSFVGDGLGAYTYSETDLTFQNVGTGKGAYTRLLVNAYSYGGTTLYQSDITSSEIFFYKENKSDSIIESWVKIAPSCAGMSATYAGRGNYVFQPEQTYELDDKFYLATEETGSFDNTVVRVDGSKKYHSCFINVAQQTGESIRFKIAAVEEHDKFEIYAIELASSGYIFDGGTENA